MWFILFFISYLLACSDFQLKCQDGSIICGRAMDFIIPMKSQILVFNRGMNMSSKAPDGSVSLQWVSKYGFIGVNAYGFYLADEGLNEKGLTCGFLMLTSTYPQVSVNEYNISIAIMDVCTWILGSFSSVDEVKAGIDSVRIWGNVMPPPIKMVMGLHIPIHDALGNNLVIEFIDGEVNMYDHPLGVLTNDPPLPYHLQNLILYNGLNPYSPPEAIINGYQVEGKGGSGMQGIPGSWSAIDRFIRISTIVRYLNNIKTALDGVLAATHILNSVYVPEGVAIASFQGHKLVDMTRWNTMKDLTNKIFYYRNSDGSIRAIYLKKIDFNGLHKTLPVYESQPLIIDETSNL